jgi:hypothetical protein
MHVTHRLLVRGWRPWPKHLGVGLQVHGQHMQHDSIETRHVTNFLVDRSTWTRVSMLHSLTLDTESPFPQMHLAGILLP